ncbi:uncharacterized protein TM35_000881110 [Trypanosoma theileri]|uniref:Uncharacterized protein n=1 Tax=Trypanosoma theileri TaxID=67003 RepID=A0A1X0NFE2_9TRYP|nr:uncharacterized protein TM35_000881110 [Trypanosoma theileri]ORC82532.1 hypothetical protein TM35_000881110 [Trypanosoma theileri]
MTGGSSWGGFLGSPGAFYPGAPLSWGPPPAIIEKNGPVLVGELVYQDFQSEIKTTPTPANTHQTQQQNPIREINEKKEDGEKITTANPRPQEVTAEKNGNSHAAVQELLRRIIALEFSGRCTQRSMTIVQTICDTLCVDPIGVIKVMEVLDECFLKAVKMKQQEQLLNYWYIVDAVMKLFRDRPPMLNAIMVTLPHLLLQYVPWKNGKLEEEPWIQREKDEARYEQLFQTWEHTVSRDLLDEIWDMWRNGLTETEAKKNTTA